MCVGRHGDINRTGRSIVEMPICDIDERLQVSEEFFFRALWEAPKIFHLMNLRDEINVGSPFVACGYYALPKFV